MTISGFSEVTKQAESLQLVTELMGISLKDPSWPPPSDSWFEHTSTQMFPSAYSL